MQVKQTDESTIHLEPSTDDEMRLVNMLFEHFTKQRPDEVMGDRTDLAMSTFTVIKQWAHDGDSVKSID